MCDLHATVKERLGDVSGDELVGAHNAQGDECGFDEVTEIYYLDSDEIDTVFKTPSTLHDAIKNGHINVHDEWFYEKEKGVYQSFNNPNGYKSPINKDALARWIIANKQFGMIGLDC
ncbi:MAG: hypothetical protein ACTIJH_06390 [Moraxellaceae bacterium]